MWTALGVKTNRQFVSVFFFFGGGGFGAQWGGMHHTLWAVPPGAVPGSTVKMGEKKSPRAASWRRVNLTIMEPLSQLLDSYPNLTDLGEGKYLTPAPSNLLHGGRTMPNSSHPVLPREWGRERGGMRTRQWEALVKFTARRPQAHWKLRPNHGTREYVPYTWPPHH